MSGRLRALYPVVNLRQAQRTGLGDVGPPPDRIGIMAEKICGLMRMSNRAKEDGLSYEVFLLGLQIQDILLDTGRYEDLTFAAVKRRCPELNGLFERFVEHLEFSRSIGLYPKLEQYPAHSTEYLNRNLKPGPATVFPPKPAPMPTGEPTPTPATTPMKDEQSMRTGSPMETSSVPVLNLPVGAPVATQSVNPNDLTPNFQAQSNQYNLTPENLRPDVASGQCPPGQFWDGVSCRGGVDMTQAGLIDQAMSFGPTQGMVAPGGYSSGGAPEAYSIGSFRVENI